MKKLNLKMDKCHSWGNPQLLLGIFLITMVFSLFLWNKNGCYWRFVYVMHLLSFLVNESNISCTSSWQRVLELTFRFSNKLLETVLGLPRVPGRIIFLWMTAQAYFKIMTFNWNKCCIWQILLMYLSNLVKIRRVS